MAIEHWRRVAARSKDVFGGVRPGDGVQRCMRRLSSVVKNADGHMCTANEGVWS